MDSAEPSGGFVDGERRRAKDRDGIAHGDVGDVGDVDHTLIHADTPHYRRPPPPHFHRGFAGVAAGIAVGVAEGERSDAHVPRSGENSAIADSLSLGKILHIGDLRLDRHQRAEVDAAPHFLRRPETVENDPRPHHI